MGERYSVVHEAAEGTFGWILEKAEHQRHRPPADFATWLAHGNGIFHICGKPGSGKSTLMKYVFEHKQTERLLQEWVGSDSGNGDAKLVLASCFFWKPGTPLQRNILGLKRTLLYSVIATCHSAGAVLFPDKWQAPNIATRVKIVLSDMDVRLAFERLANGGVRDADGSSNRGIHPYRFCFFIDGLDEFGDAGDAIVGLVRQLKKMAGGATGGIKLCVSSREYPEIASALALDAVHRLTLQDLTDRDIATLVDYRLQEIFPRYAYNGTSDSYAANKNSMENPFGIVPSIRRIILERAAGVFLWVVLVLCLIEREVELDTTPVSGLLALVEAQHDDLDAFFNDVVTRIPERDRRAVALVFQHNLDPLACDEVLFYAFLVDGYSSDKEFSDHCDRVRKQITTSMSDLALRTQAWIKRRCEGLMEPSPQSLSRFGTKPPSDEPRPDWVRMTLTHRCVHEFLVSLLDTTWKTYTVSDTDYCSIIVRLLHAMRGLKRITGFLSVNADWYFQMQQKSLIGTNIDARVHQNFLLANEIDDEVALDGRPYNDIASAAARSQCHQYLHWLYQHHPEKVVGRTTQLLLKIQYKDSPVRELPTDNFDSSGGRWPLDRNRSRERPSSTQGVGCRIQAKFISSHTEKERGASAPAPVLANKRDIANDCALSIRSRNAMRRN